MTHYGQVSILSSCRKLFCCLCVAEELQTHLAAEQEARRAVSRDLAVAQKDVEEVVQHNCELQRANTAMGDQVRQVQLDQLDLMARFEAQSAELTSLKVSTFFSERTLQTSCAASFP